MIIIKTINTRIQNKHDIESNWLKAINFIPKDGEIIIYDIDENYTYPRLKIGNGIDTVNNLPFMNKIDSTLTMSNQAADAKTVGDAIALMVSEEELNSAMSQKSAVQIITWGADD